MTTVERVCMVLESLLVAEEPIEFRRLILATGIERRTLARILRELEGCGFIERGPRGSEPGDRLDLILDSRRRSS